MLRTMWMLWALWVLLFLLGYVLGNCVLASPLNVDYLAVEGSKFQTNRDAYTPDTPPSEYTGRAALQWNVSVLGAAYWNNFIHTETVGSGIKTVGWQWELGLHALPWLDIFKAHHSRHVVEERSDVSWKDSGGRFPVEDSWGARLIFVPQVKRGSLGDLW